MKRLSKGFYFGSFAVGVSLVSGWFSFFGTSLLIGATVDIVTVALISSFITLLIVYLVIVWLVLLYKAWASIQDGFARTTPGKAIGFLFIPFYNIYWVFQAYWGFAKDYNSYVARHGVSTSRLPEKLFLSLCILFLVSGFLFGVVPFLGYALLIVSFVIWMVVVYNICDAVNSLP